MARVLLFPLSVGNVLAHAGSCATIARELAARGHEPVLAYGGEQAAALAGGGLRVERVPELDAGRLRPHSFAGVFRSAEEIVELVEQEVELIRRVRPDVAVLDSKPTAALACRLAGVPAVSVVHFLAWTRWRAPEPLVSLLRRRARVRRAVSRLRSAIARDSMGSLAFRRRWDEAATALGLDPAGGPFDGERVACTTTPLLTPSRSLPRHWRYVGPVTWSASSEAFLPSRGSRPLVYVTQGSTGSAATLARVVRELRDEPVDVLVSTAELCEPAALERAAPNVRAARLLPGRACMEAADAAIVHGGHLTTVEAHLAATPVVVVPHGYDQDVWANRAERLGTGIAVRPPSAPGAIRRAVRRVLRRERYRRAADRVAADLGRWNGPANVVDLVEEVLAERRGTATALRAG